MRVNDAVLGAILLLLASTMIWLTTYFPSFPGQDYGPALFPRLLGGGLILCGLLLVVRGRAARRRGEPWGMLDAWWSRPGQVASFFAMPAAVLAYLFFADTLGFIPLAFTLLLALFLWFGERPLRAVPAALVATLLINWFFSDMMRVPLPRGLLTNIL